jgi:2-dehydro-3-deoxyphosphogluconate aldolase / (4S)-4-hydroxy-2-oxoglutarate aldolase
MTELLQRIKNIGIIPVVKLNDAGKAKELAAALVKGHIPCAEITFRTPAAEESIRVISGELPETLVGAGTVISAELAKKAIDAGARFIVSPGFNPEVVDYCLSRNVPIIPGVNNPSNIEAALGKGLEVLKFFPAEASGGVAMLDALAGPFPQVQFMPTGGVGPSNLADYIRRPNVLAVGGSWMVKPGMIDSDDWNGIEKLCAEASLALQGFSFAHLGINQADAASAAESAALFADFGLSLKDGAASLFAGQNIEIMKTPFRGAHGHVGFKTWDIERALSYLEPFGFKPIEATKKKVNDMTTFVYLDRELGGFAIHLIREK